MRNIYLRSRCETCCRFALLIENNTGRVNKMIFGGTCKHSKHDYAAYALYMLYTLFVYLGRVYEWYRSKWIAAITPWSRCLPSPAIVDQFRNRKCLFVLNLLWFIYFFYCSQFSCNSWWWKVKLQESASQMGFEWSSSICSLWCIAVWIYSGLIDTKHNVLIPVTL